MSPTSETFERFEAQVTRDWSHLSTRITPSGTRSVGFAPWVGTHAWLHQFYAGCSVENLDRCEERIGRTLPAVWRTALGTLNGLQIFITGFNLLGVLPHGLNRRAIEDPQPMSIESFNTSRRPRGDAIATEDLVIGYTTETDVTRLLLRPDGTFVKVTRSGDRVIGSYPTLPAMISQEYDALLASYDHGGRKVPS